MQTISIAVNYISCKTAMSIIVHQSEDVRIDDVTIINDAPRATFF